MKISGTNVEVSYGDKGEADWKKPENVSDHDEAESPDTEQLPPEEKKRLKEQLGFDYEAE